MKDEMIRALDGASRLAVVMVDCTAAAGELARAHLSGSTASTCLAQALAGVALLGSETSQAEETVTFRMDSPGALEGFLVECTEKGTLRGYTKKKILNDFDGTAYAEAAVIGDTGTVEVIRSVPGKVLSSGSTAVAFGGRRHDRIAQALNVYFTQSLQRRVVTALTGAAGDDGVPVYARGVMVECPPDGDVAVYDRVAELFAAGDVAKALSGATVSPRTLLKKLGLAQAEMRGTSPLAFACRCSRERAQEMLAALPPDARADLPPTVDITCHMCGRIWTCLTQKITQLSALLFWLVFLLAVPASAAEWIAGVYEPPAEVQTNAFFAPARNSIVKKSFRAKGAVKEALWRVAAPGMRDLFVNGERVSATALPPWTPYRERILEETFDVTSAVKPGADNELAVELGNGWFNPLPLTMWYRYNLREYLATGTPSVRAVLSIAYADGTRDEIPTDASWRAFDGRVVHNNLYLGVVEDKRLEVTPTGAARVVKGPTGKVCPAGGFPKTTIIGRRQAKSVKALPGGAYLVDFGVNATGTLRVKLRNVKDGQRISFRQGERLFDDGTVNTLTATAGQIKRPERGPLFAVAEPRDTVICRTAAETVFEPRLTFHVFRYVQVEGLAEAPKMEDFESLDWSADVKDSASFVCSNERINELHAVCRRTFRSNLQSVQSDCPGREKFGYDGDVSCTAESFCCNWNMLEFYRKAIRDYLDEAAGDGLFTETAPFVGIASNPAVPGEGTRAAPIGWATGVPVLTDTVLRYYGDWDIVREAYPAFVRYLAILEKRYPDNNIPKCLGDWVPVAGNKANEELSGIAHYYQFLRLTEKFARLLNHPQDASRFAKRAESTAKTWRERFHHGNGLVGRGVQAEQLFGLYHGLVPETNRVAALEILKKDIASRGDSLTTGIFGIQYLFEYLSTHGEAVLAGRVLTHRGFPGYFDMLDRGATTLWENWEEKACVNAHSNCHPMYGGCEQWLTRHLLGIAVTEDAVGCDKVRIRPNAVAGVTWAKGHLDTPKGRISVSWKLMNGAMVVEKHLPPGITEIP